MEFAVKASASVALCVYNRRQSNVATGLDGGNAGKQGESGGRLGDDHGIDAGSA